MINEQLMNIVHRLLLQSDGFPSIERVGQIFRDCFCGLSWFVCLLYAPALLSSIQLAWWRICRLETKPAELLLTNAYFRKQIRKSNRVWEICVVLDFPFVSVPYDAIGEMCQIRSVCLLVPYGMPDNSNTDEFSEKFRRRGGHFQSKKLYCKFLPL